MRREREREREKESENETDRANLVSLGNKYRYRENSIAHIKKNDTLYKHFLMY